MMKRQETIRIPFVFELFFSNWNGHSEKNIERINLFLTYTSLMLLGSMAWALVCLSLGMNETSMIPLSYVVLTLVNLAVFQTKWSFEWCFSFQVFISVTMPFLFQMILGGVFNGGMIMIWSSLALMAGTVFLTNNVRKGFLIMFILQAVLIGIDEYLVAERFGLYMTQVLLILANYVGVTVALFFLAERFISDQMTFKNKAYIHKEKIISLEENKENQMMEVKSFKRRVLPSSMNFQTAFTDHFISVIEKDVVGSTFYWLGNFYGNDILVVIDGKWEGVYGTMMSMECRNTLNEVVYQNGEHHAPRILTALSELFLKCCPKPEEGDDPLSIVVMTYDCTSNELGAAGQGMEVYVKDGSRTGTLAEMCTMGIACNNSYYIKDSIYNTTMLGEVAHVVVYSKSYPKQIAEPRKPATFRKLLKQWADSSENPEMNVLKKELEKRVQLGLKKNTELDKDLIAIGLRLSMWD